MMMVRNGFSMMILSLALAAPAWAQDAEREVGRGHTRVGCATCHSAHKAKGEVLFAMDPNTEAINPVTKEPYTGISALCLACHAEVTEGGMGMVPVIPEHSHPFGVKADPKVANVPEELLRDGKLECVGCHDPHASNQNYMLLRVDTDGGKRMDTFCAMCHMAKAHPSDVEAVKSMRIFTSMDETQPPVVRPRPKPPVSKPAGPALKEAPAKEAPASPMAPAPKP